VLSASLCIFLTPATSVHAPADRQALIMTNAKINTK